MQESTGWGGKRRGAGRPAGTGLPAKRVRRNRIAISLTDAENARLASLAKRDGASIAEVAYRLLIKGLGRGRTHP